MAKQTKKQSEKPAATLVGQEQETTLQVEELPAPALPAVVSADQKARQEIARFDLARNWIAARKKEYKGLKISSLDDKAGQTAVHKAWQEIRNKRLAVEKKHKEIKGDYLVITRAIDGEKNELVKLLEEIEDPLKAELDRVEAEKEAIKQEAERKAQEKLQGRVAELLENGMAFNGSYYAIGDTISMDVVTLKGLNDEDYTRLLDRVKAENQKILDDKAEAARKEQEERDRLAKQKEENEKAQRELEEQKRAFQQQQEDLERQKKALIDQRTKSRAKMLEALGMAYNYSGFVWQFGTFDMGRVTLPVGTVEGVEDEQWDSEYETMAAKIKEMKEGQAAKDKERAEQQEQQRQQREKERRESDALAQRRINRETVIKERYGMVIEDGVYVRSFNYAEIPTLLLTGAALLTTTDEKWPAILQKLSEQHSEAMVKEIELQKQEAQQKEQARQAALSDVERVNEFLRTLAASCGLRPQITDAKIVAAFEAFDNKVAEAINELSEVLDSVK